VGASPRLGCVQYLNALPLIHGWEGQVRFDHPSNLCRDLAAGKLDVALVSSFEYLRHPIYFAVDRIAIASTGPVYSVILVHREPIEQLREVIIDPASETSANLLRCLLGEQSIKFVSDGKINAERGRLLIGDQAIRFRQRAGDEVQILDLGAAWQEFAALPFVYALWLIRPDYNAKDQIATQLRSLGNHNLQSLTKVIAAQPAEKQDFCEFYFRRCLRFDLSTEEKKGFQRFGELCAQRKILSGVPKPPKYI
jgi:predicted solute-binding protein